MTIHRTLLVLSCFLASSAWADPLVSDSFAKQAADASLAEVALGSLAVQKAENPAVKAFAQSMVEDHSQANSELKTVATQHGITLPTTPPPDAQAAAVALSQKAGTAFDQAYVAQMVRDHQQAVALFRTAAMQADISQDLRDFAQKSLPTLQHHLQEAQQLDAQLAGAAAQAAPPPLAPVAVSAEVVP